MTDPQPSRLALNTPPRSSAPYLAARLLQHFNSSTRSGFFLTARHLLKRSERFLGLTEKARCLLHELAWLQLQALEEFCCATGGGFEDEISLWGWFEEFDTLMPVPYAGVTQLQGLCAPQGEQAPCWQAVANIPWCWAGSPFPEQPPEHAVG